MAIDLHVFRFLRLLAARGSLGRVLTIGRQSLSVPTSYLAELGNSVDLCGPYCEPLLSAMGATAVSSVDFSSYEGATYTYDLNQDFDLPEKFDTVIDAGSLEHIFDCASAFRNIMRCCTRGGRVVHVLPVNNLNGHGFWQCSSDLLYSVYSERNGFAGTEVYYASSLDPSSWWRVPPPRPGGRTQVVSIEPLILLSVSRKTYEPESVRVLQPYYEGAWEGVANASMVTNAHPGSAWGFMKKRLNVGNPVVRGARNCWTVFGLLFGVSCYSVKRFERVRVERLLESVEP